MKKKAIAYIILTIITLMIAGLVLYFFKTSKLDILADAALNKKSVPILMSFEYEEKNEENSLNRIFSFVLLLNQTTNQMGILELPAYTGIYESTLNIVVPLDYFYVTENYKDYIKQVRNVLNLPHLEYIFIEKENLAKFIDVLGGVSIFLIDSEVPAEDIASSYTVTNSTELGDVNFDGPNMQVYLNNIENSNSNELLKSTKRKEFVFSILTQIQNEKIYYENSKKLLQVIDSHVATSLDISVLQKVFLLLSGYQLDQAYFQRITGRLQNIDISTISDNQSIDKRVSKTKILFTSTEVGNLSKIYTSLENKLTQDRATTLEKQITITILNGTIVNGLAGNTRELFENAGFIVLSIGNASRNDIETTTIIDRTGNINEANYAANLIGAKSVITDITSVDQAGSDITLILGKDFDGEIVR